MNWTKVDNIYMGTKPVRRAYIGSNKVWPSEIEPYLEFTSPSSFTLKVYNTTKNWDGTIDYSVDKTNWDEWDGTTTLTAVASNNLYRLYLRGSNNTKLGGDTTSYRWVFTGSNITTIGDMRVLLDYEDPVNSTMAAYCFAHLFYGNTAIITCPDFPATTLSDSCYMYTLRECTNLIAPCELPAMNLTPSCYYGMFEKCTKLIRVCELPALTLTEYCYRAMFSECKAITMPPRLVATTLALGCYRYMLNGCTSMTTIPAIHATHYPAECLQNFLSNNSQIKFSKTQDETYQNVWQIPIEGTGTSNGTYSKNAFQNTGGTFKTNPVINTTYYTSNEVLL